MVSEKIGMNEHIISVSALEKKYNHINAVQNLNFELKTGDLVAFLGPNGAGKSTTMRMLTGFVVPDNGRICYNNIDIQDQPKQIKATIGYLPEGGPLYPEMPVQSMLSFVGGVRGISKNLLKKQVDKTLQCLHLENVRHQIIETLSKGYKRRVALGCALIHDPDILILDEPTDGLDPNQKHEIRQLLKSISSSKLIIISTHLLEDVGALCNRALIIAGGRLIEDCTPPALLEKYSPNNGSFEEVFRMTTQHHQQRS